MNHKNAFGFGAAIGSIIVSFLIVAQIGNAQRDPQNVGPQRYGDFNVTGSQAIGNQSLGSGRLKVEQSGETSADGFQIFRPSAAGTSARFWIDSSDAFHVTRGTSEAISVSAAGATTVEQSGGNVCHDRTRTSDLSVSDTDHSFACASGVLSGGGCTSSSTSVALVMSGPTSDTTWRCVYASAVNITVHVLCCVY